METDKKASIFVTREGWLDNVKHGSLSGYVRAVVDRRIEEVAEAVRELRKAYSDEEIGGLIAAAEMPAHRARDTDLATLQPKMQGYVYTLAGECEATGLPFADITRLLDAGVCA